MQDASRLGDFPLQMLLFNITNYYIVNTVWLYRRDRLIKSNPCVLNSMSQTVIKRIVVIKCLTIKVSY